MRRILPVTILAAAAVSTATAACLSTLAPHLVRELPQDHYVSAGSIAWRDDGRILIGTRTTGIMEYVVATGATSPAVPGVDIPNGLPAVEKLDTDGRTVVAFNSDRSDIAFDLAARKMLHARRNVAMRVMDIAVSGDRVAILGYPFRVQTPRKGQLWVGSIGAPWEELTLLREFEPKTDAIARYAVAPHAGAVRFIDAKTVAMVTPAEPGVIRYRIDGTALPTLGADLTELVIPSLPDMLLKFNQDVIGRYEQIMNRQPTADDLVVTSKGLAVVVRRWANGNVWWELWFPELRKTERTIRLGIQDKRTAGGHLRCAGRGTLLACMFGKATQLGRPDRSHLVLFDLMATKTRCG